MLEEKDFQRKADAAFEDLKAGGWEAKRTKS